MKWEFMAENYDDALGVVLKWMQCGIMPVTPYVVRKNPERDGYFIAEVR